MTVSSEQSYIEYNGDGVTKTFTIPFYFILGSDISITLTDSNGTETQLINGTDYSVVGDGSSSGGAATLNVAPASGIEVTIYRNPPVTQETAYYENGKFPAKSHEKALDKLTMLIQTALYRLNIYNSKAIKVPESGNWVAPKIADRKNKIFAWNDSGYPIAVLPPDGSASDVMIELAKPTGAGLIGTNHRGTLASDLNAIDRRPDGYGNSISAVLANGDDVEINKDISISSATVIDSGKYVIGAGGTITETTGLAAVLRADGFGTTAKEGITVSNLDAVGSVLSTDDSNDSVESYGVFSYNSLYLRVMGMRASGLTGGVYLGQSRFAIASDITAHDLVYHPNLARGGYGVLTDGSKESIINNVALEVGPGTNGRHVLYMSTGGHGVVDANRNLIANNLIGRYSGKNDRNFPVVVVRKSERFIINNVVGDGANAGLAFNMANGEVSDYIINNHNYDLVKYADGVGVYGISQGDTPNPGNRWLIANSVIRVRPAAGLTSADCVAVSITHSNGLLSNLTCSIPNGSSPILIGDSATNVLINGVLDNVLPYDALTTAPLIAFTGSAASNIKVSGIKTSRPMFARLAVVTDLTVDFDRKARITTNGSGGSTKIDSNEIIGTVSLSATAVTVNFPTHVTQNAVENVRVVGTAGAFQAFVTTYGAKSITLALYTAAGVLINPLTTSASFNVILTS